MAYDSAYMHEPRWGNTNEDEPPSAEEWEAHHREMVSVGAVVEVNAESMESRLREALEGGTTFPDLSRIGWLSALLAEDFEQHVNWESIEDPDAWHTAIRESREMVRLVRAALA
jgi:hypothetical protein